MPSVCILFLVFMNQTHTKNEIKMHQIDEVGMSNNIVMRSKIVKDCSSLLVLDDLVMRGNSEDENISF